MATTVSRARNQCQFMTAAYDPISFDGGTKFTADFGNREFSSIRFSSITNGIDRNVVNGR
jgi:hypothetical protein